MKKHHGGRILGAWLLLASVSLAAPGCKKKEAAQKESDLQPAPSASVDRLADGKRLEKSIQDWTKRWNDFTPLPTCEKLLQEGDLQHCTAADAALTALKTAVAEAKPQQELMHAAAELALAAEQANERLRAVMMEKANKEGATPGAKPPAGGVKPPTPPATPKAAPPGSAGKAPLAAERLRGRDGGAPTPPNPDNAIVEAYGRAARLALRYLSTYLQYGPLPTRQAAYAEFEQLSNKRPAWPGLLRSLREASLMEKDPTLSTKLKDLVSKLRALAPKPTLPASSAPPNAMHPAVPPPGMKGPSGPIVKPPAPPAPPGAPPGVPATP
jgi:hypothetical protein